MKQLFVALLLGRSMILAAQVPVEVFAGHKQLQHEFFFFKDLDQEQNWNLFSMARFGVDYENDKFNTAFISSQLTYNLDDAWGVSGGGIFADTDFAPILAISYVYSNEKDDFFLNVFPTWIMKENAEYEMFGMVFYTPKLRDKLNLFSQLIFGTTLDHRLREHVFSYQQLRLGVDWAGFAQLGFAMDQNVLGGGESISYSNNLGVFIRKEL